MLKFNRVVVASLSLFLSTSFCSVAKAQEENVCYMVNNRGEYINLDGVCQNNGNRRPLIAQNSFISDVETRYLEAYKRAAISRPDGYFIVKLAQIRPDIEIGMAQAICDNLKAGISRDRLRENLVREIVESDVSEKVKQRTMNSLVIHMVLAPKYFCPEMAER